MARQPPAFLRSLGSRPFPAQVHVEDDACQLQRVFKHDFWAGTALYQGEHNKVVVKIHRQASVFGLPLRWAGRLMSGHESRMLQRAQGIPGIPRWRGSCEGTGLIHDYVEGGTHRRGAPMAESFVQEFRELLRRLHERDVAYVDLEKPENVLVGEDGSPYLVDFQISFFCPAKGWGRLPPLRWLLRRLQAADRYHFVKMVRRGQSHLLTEEERQEFERKPWYIRLHSFCTRPLTRLRRWILRKLDPHRSRERGR
jgi:hypothetical protein